MKLKPTKKYRKFKILIIFLISLIAVVLILTTTFYIIVHGYISKLNRVKSSDEITYVPDTDSELAGENTTENTETEAGAQENGKSEPDNNIESEVEPMVTDSPKQEIQLVEEKIRANMEENSTPIMKDKDVFNVLLIGSDTRKGKSYGNSDTMIIISINKKTKKIVATSLLRDIYLEIPGIKNNRINVAYAYGGADLLMKTIKQNFKIEIDRYASINFNTFIDIVDAVGGITLEITEEEIPIINYYVRELNRLNGQPEDQDILTEPGTYQLKGIQVLGYARNRYIGMDFERTARQRWVLELIFNKVKDLNLSELNDLLNKVLPQITTNLTEGELFSLILGLPAYSKYSLEEWSIPVKGTYSFVIIRRMDVIGIDFKENIKELQKRIYGEK